MSKIRHALVATLALAAALAPMQAAAAAEHEGPGFTLIADVETERSGWDGSRDCKWSEQPSTITAPPGYVINEQSVRVTRLVDRGTDLYEKTELTDRVPVLGPITMPRTISVWSHACSSRGSFGGAGRLQVQVTGEWVKVP